MVPNDDGTNQKVIEDLKKEVDGLRHSVAKQVSYSVHSSVYYRATRIHCADYAVERCPSVYLSVRLSHAGILSKRLHISSIFFHRRVASPFWFSRTKWDGNIPTGTP